ncbi:hypothetical protein U1Q18_019028 [Sarracenia purpurea var. burkii]
MPSTFADGTGAYAALIDSQYWGDAFCCIWWYWVELLLGSMAAGWNALEVGHCPFLLRKILLPAGFSLLCLGSWGMITGLSLWACMLVAVIWLSLLGWILLLLG